MCSLFPGMSLRIVQPSSDGTCESTQPTISHRAALRAKRIPRLFHAVQVVHPREVHKAVKLFDV